MMDIPVHLGEAYALQFGRGVFRLSYHTAIHRRRRGLVVGYLEGVGVYEGYMFVLGDVGVGFVDVADYIATAVEPVQRGRKALGYRAEVGVVDVRRVSSPQRGVVILEKAVCLFDFRHQEADDNACGIVNGVSGPGDEKVPGLIVLGARRIVYHHIKLVDDFIRAPVRMVYLRHKVGVVSQAVHRALTAASQHIRLRQRDSVRRAAPNGYVALINHPCRLPDAPPSFQNR